MIMRRVRVLNAGGDDGAAAGHRPNGGYDYQSRMLAEITALRKAITAKTSTQKL